MNEIEEFLAVNGLKQIELANYLGVNKSTISQAVSGRAKLHQSKVNKILMNKNGWDCSMFDRASVVQKIGDNSNNNTQVAGNAESLKWEVELLKQLLEEKERTIQILLNK